MTIGFDPVTYFVNETDGSVTLIIRVLDGQLARSVEVDFTTRDGTATSTAPEDFIGVIALSPIILQFSPSDLVQQASVVIIDDDKPEIQELFAGFLSSIDPAVILAPKEATVEIGVSDRE